MDSAEQRYYHSGSDDDLGEDCEKACDLDNNGDVPPSNNKLDISQEQADKNYEAAGREVNEEEERIRIGDYQNEIDPDVDSKLDEIVARLKMPYLPANFQRVAINALVQLKNVVLISPTGSGKMNVPLLASLLLREQLDKPNG